MLEAGDLCSDDSQILTEIECQEAGDAVGFELTVTVEDAPLSPPWCYWSNGNILRFNTNSNGQAHHNRHPICKFTSNIIQSK